MKNLFSAADAVVIAITFVLFVAALFTKGFTNALLLEAGVLLVSVKIIMMNYKLSITNQKIIKKLDDLEKNLSNKEE